MSASRARSPGLILAAAVLGAAVGGLVVWLGMHTLRHGPVTNATPDSPAANAGANAGATSETVRYQCPMHPTITSDSPGDCPICGMKLVPIKSASSKDAATNPASHAAHGATPSEPADPVGLATVTIDPARQQMIGLRTAPAQRGSLASSWRTVGKVQVDPTRVRKVNVKVEGFIERIYIDFLGRPVRRGEPLFLLYSPALLAAQNELLLATRTAKSLSETGGAFGQDAQSLVASARRKLELWDVPQAEIERMENSTTPIKSVTFVSPITGIVTAKNIVEGSRIGPGDTPYEITDLSMVWVMADAYESDLQHVRVGMPATLTLSAYPEREFRGRVEFIDPLLDPKSRTVKVHIHFANAGLELLPEMFGEVVLRGTPRETLRIPVDAVIHSGTRDVVFVALGEGKLRPQEVQLGGKDEKGEYVEVRSGLAEGDLVVTRANFLIDSESQLRASLAAIDDTGGSK